MVVPGWLGSTLAVVLSGGLWLVGFYLGGGSEWWSLVGWVPLPLSPLHIQDGSELFHPHGSFKLLISMLKKILILQLLWKGLCYFNTPKFSVAEWIQKFACIHKQSCL